MGLLTATFGGVVIPVKITKLNRNLTPAVSNKTQSIGNGDGVELVYSRREEKRISFDYVIDNRLAKDLSDFRRKTAGILNSKIARELIFSDEPTLYYDAILDGEQTLAEDFLSSSGSLTFLVPDGVAHSKVEKTFSAVNTNGILEATIVNNGTEAVPIDYTITHNHENGYIGIVSDHGVIQLGDLDELDGEVKKKSELLINYRNPAAFDAMTSGQAVLAADYPKDGSFKTVSADGKQWIALNGISSGQSWHGAGKKVTIPPDTSGVQGGADFYAQAKVWFETGRLDQTGLAEFSVGDDAGKHLASIKLAKYELGTNHAYAIFCIQGEERLRYGFVPNNSGVTTFSKGQIYIKKSGELFEFYFGGGKWQYRVPAAASKKAATVSIFLGQHGTRGASNLLTRMYFDYIFFQKDNVSYWYDIPNRYRNGSVVYVDGSTSKIYVDGVASMEDEMLGSRYFKAPPGETKVQFYYSDFCNPAPVVTAKIREAYL